MSCENWEQAIALCVDGEPAPPQLETHLAGCLSCRELRDGLLADQIALRRWPIGANGMSRDLHVGIMRRVRRPWVPRLVWYAAAAAIFAIVLVTNFRRVPVPESLPKPVALLKSTEVAPPRPAMRTAAAPRKGTVRQKAIPRVITDAEWRELLDEFMSDPKPPALHAPASDVAMWIQSRDPEVVILWLNENRQGGSDE